jgi:2-hydroxychromene-2-carboxylate isomerase
VRVIHYFSPMSGFAYLGFAELRAMAKRHGAEVDHRPVDIARVFAAVDTIAPARQAPARLAWRRTDMMRWAQRRNLPLNAIPKHWPVDATLASCAIIAAQGMAADAAPFIDAILSAVWARDEDIANENTIAALAQDCGHDAAKVLADARSDAVRAAYDANTQDAIAHGVIGSPTMRLGDESFFGQDRLDFVEAELARINLA